MLLTIVTFVIILSVLVLAHECGHFFTAKKMGVKVEEFGLGLPPRIFGFKRKNSETTISLNWIPFGAFVKIKGENGEDKDDPSSFGNKKIWQRGIILSSGVIMNAILAIILFSFCYLIGFPSITEGLSKYAKVKDEKIKIMEVVSGYPAEIAGLESGDTLLSIDGKAFKEISDVQKYVSDKAAVEFKIERNKTEIVKNISTQKENNVNVIGVALTKVGMVTYPWYLSLWEGIKTTFSLIFQIIVALFLILKNLIFGKGVGADITGPIGAAVVTNTMVKLGLVYVLQFMALISVNLAVINFLPIPALDGGRILFLILEKIKGKPVQQKVEAMIHTAGFALLMFLMVLITYRDLAHFGGKIFQKITGH